MNYRNRKKLNLSHKLSAITLLTIILSCPNCFCNEESNAPYFDYLAQLSSQKLYNPIQLDTTQATKVKPKTDTTIPYNLIIVQK